MSAAEKLRKTTLFLLEKLGGFVPETLLVLGSGLGFMAEEVSDKISIPYGEIPHFKTSTAPGHAGRLVFGSLEGKNVAVMQGRMHYYEGYSFAEIVYPVYTLKKLGAANLILTNAAGGINLDYRAGDFMLINDHIKMFDESPIRGENDAKMGPRFPDMSYVYTPRLRNLTRRVAEKMGMGLREGVYMFFPGPQYETPAEIRAARTMGADAVGMSTVPEAIAACYSGMDILGISLISNMAAGVLPSRLSEEEVLEAAREAKDRFSGLLRGVLKSM